MEERCTKEHNTCPQNGARKPPSLLFSASNGKKRNEGRSKWGKIRIVTRDNLFSIKENSNKKEQITTNFSSKHHPATLAEWCCCSTVVENTQRSLNKRWEGKAAQGWGGGGRLSTKTCKRMHKNTHNNNNNNNNKYNNEYNNED
eukprot:gene12369-8495_t